MKTLIVYATKHGTAEECAKMLAQRLEGEVELVNIKNSAPPSLDGYEKIILGASIYAGSAQPEIKEFCRSNLEKLKEKPVGLFLSCMFDEENQIRAALENAFTPELVSHAAAACAFGGAFKMDRLNFFEKLIVKMVAKEYQKNGKLDGGYDGKTDISTVSDSKISEFAKIINAA